MPGGIEFCALSATGIQDPTGQVFAFGTWSLQFKPTPNTPGPFVDTGANGPSFVKIFGGSLDATGSFNSGGGVVRNDVISPAGSRWVLQVTPALIGMSFQVELNLTAAVVDCTAAINAVITTLITTPTPISRAYKDSELINIDGSGGLYYDETLKVLKVWDAATGTWLLLTPGLFVPSGTGFTHVTAGVQDAAARNAVLASSDFANQGTIHTVLHGNAAGNPAFGVVTSADIDTSIAATGVDINTLNQVIATHLTVPLPVVQGGTGVALSTGSGSNVLSISPALQTPTITGTVINYDGFPTVGTGLPPVVATADLTGQTANIGATGLITLGPAGGGVFNVEVYIIVTSVGTTSTLPAVNIIYTDRDNNTVQTVPFNVTVNTNTLNTLALASFPINVKSSTTISFSTTGYASTGTPMQYAVRIKVLALG